MGGASGQYHSRRVRYNYTCIVVSLASQIMVAIALRLQPIQSKIHNTLCISTFMQDESTVFIPMQCNFLVLTMVQICMHDSEWIQICKLHTFAKCLLSGYNYVTHKNQKFSHQKKEHQILCLHANVCMCTCTCTCVCLIRTFLTMYQSMNI